MIVLLLRNFSKGTKNAPELVQNKKKNEFAGVESSHHTF
jgi:hypothetical protein